MLHFLYCVTVTLWSSASCHKISVGFVTADGMQCFIQYGRGGLQQVGWLLPCARLYPSLSLNASSVCERFFSRERDAKGLDEYFLPPFY